MFCALCIVLYTRIKFSIMIVIVMVRRRVPLDIADVVSDEEAANAGPQAVRAARVHENGARRPLAVLCILCVRQGFLLDGEEQQLQLPVAQPV